MQIKAPIPSPKCNVTAAEAKDIARREALRLNGSDERDWQTQALAGAVDDAILTVERALETNPEELMYRPYALRLRGELRLKIGQPELAEADFRDAIALARRMSAKLV